MTSTSQVCLDRRIPRAVLEAGKQVSGAPVGEWLRGAVAAMTSELLWLPQFIDWAPAARARYAESI
jgi:hypothetical protein